MCKYCKIDENGEMTENKPIFDKGIGGKGLRFDICVQLAGTGVMGVGVAINDATAFGSDVRVKYCPMCGRKFNAGE